MDSCCLECLQCERPIKYYINPSFFHGLCDACSESQEHRSLICKTCESECDIYFLEPKEITYCISCGNEGNELCDKCHNYCCKLCYNINKHCPNCACLICKTAVYTNDFCNSHKLCKKCSSKHLKCPFCQCQACSLNPATSKLTCGHPVCPGCPEALCIICSEVCSYCKKPTKSLKGNHCKSHFGCPDCFQNFIVKDIKRCHICNGNYLNFKCMICKKLHFDIQTCNCLEEKHKVCIDCCYEYRCDLFDIVKTFGKKAENPQEGPQISPQKSPQGNPQDDPEISPQKSPQGKPQDDPEISPQKSPQGKPQDDAQKSSAENLPQSPKENPKSKHYCHFCKSETESNTQSNCKNGLTCSGCHILGLLETCVICAELEKKPCTVCLEATYLFTNCPHERCLACLTKKCVFCEGYVRCPDCEAIVEPSFVNEHSICDNCTGLGTCVICQNKKRLNDGYCEDCFKCEVCRNPRGKIIVKNCSHFQCEACLTSVTAVKCSKCLNQYKCEEHNQGYFLTGINYFLNRCCMKVVCRDCRVELNSASCNHHKSFR